MTKETSILEDALWLKQQIGTKPYGFSEIMEDAFKPRVVVSTGNGACQTITFNRQ